jgi:carbon-monoxide dehydrogenase large subunit
LSVGLFDVGARLDEDHASACVGESAFEGEHATYPNGAYVCEVDIDGETGQVRIVSFTCVDDLGTVLNPTIATGQVIGGVVQGIGQALLEETIYDDDSGQLLSGSFMDYALPRADDLPVFTSALTGAVVDALGGREFDMPSTPERIWLAMGEAGGEQNG